MGDQPVTKADFEGFASTITTTLTTALTALTNQMTLLTTEIRNGNNNTNQQRGRREKSTKDLQTGIDFEHQMQVLINKIKYQQKTRAEALRVPRKESNPVVIDENTDSNEGSLKEEIGQENLHNNYDSHMDAEEELVKDELVDQGNKQSNRVKTDILLFYGISEVDKTLIIPDEKLVVQRNFKTLIANEHEKHYKEDNPSIKKSSMTLLTTEIRNGNNNTNQQRGRGEKLIRVSRSGTDIGDQLTALINRINIQQKARKESIQVPQGGNNRVGIEENLIFDEEESMEEESGQRNLQDNHDSRVDADEEFEKDEIVDQENQQSNHEMKTNIPLFYGTSKLKETIILEGALVIQKNFKELIVDAHGKHYKEKNPGRNISSVLVMIHSKRNPDEFFKNNIGLINVVKEKTTILEEVLEILIDFKELSSDGYLHDFPPMRDKADEILYLEDNSRSSSLEVEESDAGA
ncbi:hypothetical protein ISN44_As06g036560 [Arabidopsis suecica]|uniref:Uncharacterized protein n=1 Tax=Arabidopsis suecica TaxID=45249 RepID=A0A8T2CXF3_ARASU|nr:hypothetical protein ISN44_As06g036560 [Arabidopsis suecica]